MEKIKVMRDWLQTEHNMFLPDEVHNIISEEVKNETYGVEDIALISIMYISLSLFFLFVIKGSIQPVYLAKKT